jgi:hypothetical protein
LKAGHVLLGLIGFDQSIPQAAFGNPPAPHRRQGQQHQHRHDSLIGKPKEPGAAGVRS